MKQLIVLCIGFVFGVSLSQAGQEMIFKVPVGSNSAAIQKIIDKASADKSRTATIVFAKGEYVIDNTLLIKKSVRLKGEGTDSKLIIKKVLPVDFVDIRAAIRIEDVYEKLSVTIENLSIISSVPHDSETKGQAGGSVGIFIVGSKDVKIVDCKFQQLRTAIACYGSEKCIFENNVMRTVGYGISISPARAKRKIPKPAHIIKNNKIIPFGKGGINIWKSDDCQVLNNYLQGKDKRTGGAIFFTSCNRTIVRDNVVSRCENGIQFVTYGGRTCDDNVVERNIVYGCHPLWPTGCGLSLAADYNGRFRNNVFRANTVFDCDAGIMITQPNPKYHGQAEGTIIENNTIYDCVEWGILLSGAKRTTVKNNRITNTKFVGIELRAARNGKLAERNIIAGNFVYDSAICGLLIRSGNDYNVVKGNVFKDNFKGEIRAGDVSHTVIINNMIHETMGYNKYNEGVQVGKGTENKTEGNKFYFQDN